MKKFGMVTTDNWSGAISIELVNCSTSDINRSIYQDTT